MRQDQRSPEAARWRAYYKTPAWRRAREAQLARQPLCERCLEAGRVTAATVVNHRRPHKGSWALFLDPGNHESCCKPHHDREIQSEERRGYRKAIGDDGWPTDPRHPSA